MVILEYPTPIIEKDILFLVRATLIFKLLATQVLVSRDSASLISWSSMSLPGVAPQALNGGTPERAVKATIVVIQLMDHNLYLHRRQYFLKKKAKLWLKLIIDELLATGLLVPHQCPCNTPILTVVKLPGKYCVM